MQISPFVVETFLFSVVDTKLIYIYIYNSLYTIISSTGASQLICYITSSIKLISKAKIKGEVSVQFLQLY